MDLLDLLAVVLFILPIADWVAATILTAAAIRKPRIASLTERATSAVVLAGAATVVAVLAWARLTGATVPADLAVIVLTTALVAISVPALIWLWKFVTGQFGGSEPPAGLH